MSEKLLRKIDAIRRRAILLVWIRAICLVMISLVLSVMAVVSIDFLTGTNSTGLRAIWLFSIVAVFVIGIVKWMIPALNYWPDQVDVAKRLEFAGNEWNDELSTSIQLARSLVDSKTGSVSRHNALIERSCNRLNAAVWSFVRIDTIVTPVACLIMVTSMGGFFLASYKPVILQSLTRISQPWADSDWPTKNHLVVDKLPDRVARGDSLSFQVRDQNQRLTNGVIAQIEYAGQNGQQSMELTRKTDDSTFAGKLNRVQYDVRLRFIGGDHITPWHLVKVVDAPRLSSIAVSWHHPDVDSGQAHPTNGPFRCWPGTILDIQGRADLQLITATLVQENGGKIQGTAMRILDDPTRFESTPDSIVIKESGEFWIDLTSEKGVTSILPIRTPFEVIEDLAPIAIITTADSKIGLQSNVSLDIEIRDELEINNGEIEVHRNDINPDSRVFLGKLELRRDMERDKEFSRQYTARLELDVSKLKDLAIGDRLFFSPVVVDVKGNLAVSSSPGIEIVTQDHLRNVGNKQIERLVRLLDELEVQQSFLQTQIHSLVDKPESGEQAWRRELAQAMANQRRVLALFDQGEHSTWKTNLAIVQYFDRHRLVSEKNNQLKLVNDQQQQVAQTIVPEIRSLLTKIEKTGELLPEWNDRLASDLKALSENQSQFLAEVRSAANRLRSAASFEQLVARAKQIRDSLVRLLNETTELNQRILSGIESGESRAIVQMTIRLSQLRNDTERLVRLVSDASNNESDSNHRKLVDAKKATDQSRLLTTMFEAESSMAIHRLGQSIRFQQMSLEALDQLISILDPVDAQQAGGLVADSTLSDQINQVIEQMRRIDTELEQFSQSGSAMDQETRRNLDSKKTVLVEELSNLRHAIQASQFANLTPLIEQATEYVMNSNNSMDPTKVEREARSIRQALIQMEQMAVEIAPRKNENPESTDLTTVHEILVSVLQAQEQIAQWTNRVISSSDQPSVGEFEDIQTLQRKVIVTFESAASVLEKYPTAAILTGSIRRMYLELPALARDVILGDDILAIQQRVVFELAQLIDAIEIQLQANQNPSEISNDDSTEGSQPESAGISSFELTMLYVLQKGLQRDTETLRRQLIEAGMETPSLKVFRQDMANRQREIATVLERLLKSPNQTIPPVPDFQELP